MHYTSYNIDKALLWDTFQLLTVNPSLFLNERLIVMTLYHEVKASLKKSTFCLYKINYTVSKANICQNDRETCGFTHTAAFA